MEIFGLTPIDAALSALGLNYAQKIMDFLFVQSQFGLLAFAIGFIWSVWQSSRQANFKHFAIFIFISLAGILLLIAPKRQEASIKSANEVYGTSSISAQALKDSQSKDSSMPVILSFFAQMTDALSISIIQIVDQSLSNDLRFLNNPFGVQKLSLQANDFIYSPLSDRRLREDLDGFLYAQYLPALYIYTSNDHPGDIHSFWMGDTRIVENYSVQGKNQWEDIQSRLAHLMENPQGPWRSIKNIPIMKAQNNLDEQIIASIIHGQYAAKKPVWLRWAEIPQIFFPYVLGGASFLLYMAFPFLILGLIIFRRMNLFLHYAEIFLWIKSWVLCFAVSYYLSLFVVYIQSQGSEIAWFWEFPYYVAVSSVFLILTPILSFLGIHRSFQFNRSS